MGELVILATLCGLLGIGGWASEVIARAIRRHRLLARLDRMAW